MLSFHCLAVLDSYDDGEERTDSQSPRLGAILRMRQITPGKYVLGQLLSSCDPDSELSSDELSSVADSVLRSTVPNWFGGRYSIRSDERVYQSSSTARADVSLNFAATYLRCRRRLEIVVAITLRLVLY